MIVKQGKLWSKNHIAFQSVDEGGGSKYYHAVLRPRHVFKTKWTKQTSPSPCNYYLILLVLWKRYTSPRCQ